MAIQKIKKTSWLRRRFIQGKALRNLDTWLDEAEILKNKILTDSTYQLVGDKVILSFNPLTKIGHVLFEVLGIPGSSLQYVDLEPGDTLICELELGPFDVDFLTVIARAEALKQKITHSLEETFHIVFEGHNLALHFFIQKDYIQARDT
jgi:hypothetical protein